MHHALAIEHVFFRYHKDWVIDNFSAHIQLGECCLIRGDNGSGKTSLLKLIEGELQPQKGVIHRHPSVQHACAYLPQIHRFDLHIPVTTLQMLSMGLWKQTGALRALSRSSLDRIQQAVELTHLNGLEHKLVSELSGGQLQRARFARAWLQNEPLILLDEPFSSVDKKTSSVLWQVIQRWQLDGKTLLIVLHEQPVPESIAYRTLGVQTAPTFRHV
jgi:zinc/manganese transport system ATP-binding protein